MEDSKMDATADNGRVCSYGYCRPSAQILRCRSGLQIPASRYTQSDFGEQTNLI